MNYKKLEQKAITASTNFRCYSEQLFDEINKIENRQFAHKVFSYEEDFRNIRIKINQILNYIMTKTGSEVEINPIDDNKINEGMTYQTIQVICSELNSKLELMEEVCNELKGSEIDNLSNRFLKQSKVIKKDLEYISENVEMVEFLLLEQER